MDPAINRFYEAPLRGTENIFQLWARAAEVGAAIVPSVYNDHYKNFVVSLIEGLCDSERGSLILSIGSGVGNVELALHQKGYLKLLCSDVMEQAVMILLKRGLAARRFSGLSIPSDLKCGVYKLVIMDGCIGHMADSFVDPLPHPFTSALMEARSTLCPKGYLLLSDDPPSNSSDFELNPRVPLLRVSSRVLLKELAAAGFSVRSTQNVPYDRPEVGRVFRRVVVAQKTCTEEDGSNLPRE